MENHVIILLPKSPRPKKGRIGPDKKQNWYHAINLALNFIKQYSPTQTILIVIPSSFKCEGKKEDEFYRNCLTKKKFLNDFIFTNIGGNETVSQIQKGIYAAKGLYPTVDLAITIVWPCRVHYWRWRSIKSLIHIPTKTELFHAVNTKGRPRPKEFVADIILAIAFRFFKGPALKWYFKTVNARREAGKI